MTQQEVSSTKRRENQVKKIKRKREKGLKILWNVYGFCIVLPSFTLLSCIYYIISPQKNN
jgi:hypothetical protein